MTLAKGKNAGPLLGHNRRLRRGVLFRHITVCQFSLFSSKWIKNTKIRFHFDPGSKEIGFTFGSDTAVSASCSIVWLGRMFVFGGLNYERQISLVENCELTKKGELPFNMHWGACAQRNNQEVFICFETPSNAKSAKNCHRSTDPLTAFTKLPSSNFFHTSIPIAVTSGKPYQLLTGRPATW